MVPGYFKNCSPQVQPGWTEPGRVRETSRAVNRSALVFVAVIFEHSCGFSFRLSCFRQGNRQEPSVTLFFDRLIVLGFGVVHELTCFCD